MIRRLSPFALVLVVAAGCSVPPALPLEADPTWAHLPLPGGNHALAVAPVRAAAPGDLQSWPEVTRTERRGAPARLAEREYALRLAPPARELQERLASVAGWVLSQGRPARLLTGPAGDSEGLRLDLVVHEYRVAWVERGDWWWPNLLLFYGPGLYPVVLIPDERYEVALRATLELVDGASGRPVASERFRVSYERDLNDAQRGWSLSGLLFLYPWFLDDGDLSAVEEVLRSHVAEALMREVALWLRGLVPLDLGVGAPDEPGTPAAGEPAPALVGAGPRTFALVVVPAGPGEIPDPSPWTTALADALQEAAGVDGVEVLAGGGATPAALLATLARVGARMRSGDALLVYHGGRGVPASAPAALALDRGALPLAQLADAVARAVPSGGRVTFLLDNHVPRLVRRPGQQSPRNWVGAFGALSRSRDWVLLAAVDRDARPASAPGPWSLAASLTAALRSGVGRRVSAAALAEAARGRVPAGAARSVLLRGERHREPLVLPGGGWAPAPETTAVPPPPPPAPAEAPEGVDRAPARDPLAPSLPRARRETAR